MKEYLVIVLFISNCAAVEHTIQVASLPEPSAADNVPRIIGGHPTSIEKYPFAVQMLYKSKICCGGSLITLRHVLTAAHCFFSKHKKLSLEDFSIIAGSSNPMKGGSTRTISRLVIEPYYDKTSRLDNDVAVMLLNKNLRSSHSISVALLPRQGDTVPDNSVVWAIGWGTTVFGVLAPPTTLQEVQLLTVNRTECNEKMNAAEEETLIVTENMICSGIEGEGKASCHGDSGSPLLYSGIVVGVTSWALDCGNPFFPGVYAMTSEYIDWINETVTQYNAGTPVGTISGLVLFTLLISALILGSQLSVK